MRVCLLCPQPLSEPRSAAILCGQLAEGLRQRGHVVVSIPPKPLHRLGGNLVARLIREIGFIPLVLRRALVAGPCDAIVAYSPPPALGVAALILGVLWRSPTILWLQDSFSNILESTGAVRNSFLLASVRLFERILYRLVSRVVVAGVDLNHVQQFVGPAKLVTIHNWPTVSTNGERIPSRGEFLALFGGALGYAQDFDVILDAGERLRETNIQLVIAGDGPMWPYITAQIRKRDLRNVILMAFLPPREYDQLVRQAGAGLVTLKPGVASIPSKLVAFMAAGVPVVAAVPDGSAATLVEESGGGYRVPAGNATHLAGAILWLAQGPEFCKQASENGRAFAQAYLSPELAFDRWDQVIAELVADGRGTTPG